jgi:hypothetical protein
VVRNFQLVIVLFVVIKFISLNWLAGITIILCHVIVNLLGLPRVFSIVIFCLGGLLMNPVEYESGFGEERGRVVGVC